MDAPSDPSPAESRPPDEWILEQQNAIREESSTKPYIGPLEKLQALSEEYQEGTVFRTKIAKLESAFGHFRRVRGDGNCLFRGFLYSYLEHLLTNRDEANNFLGRLSGMTTKLVSEGYQELVFEDSLQLLIDTVKNMHENGSNKIDREMLLYNLNGDEMVSNLLVMLMRMIAGAELRARDSFFIPFILGTYEDCSSTDSFVSRYVGECVTNSKLYTSLIMTMPHWFIRANGGGGGSHHDPGSHGCPQCRSEGRLPRQVRGRRRISSGHLRFCAREPAHWD